MSDVGTSSIQSMVRRKLAARFESSADGTRVPPERELAEELGVSRSTLRKVLDDFERDGVLQRRQGSGTYVSAPSRPRVAHQLLLNSFSEEMRRIGMTSTSRVIASSREPAGPKFSKRLRVSPFDLVIHIERLRLGDGEPMALERLALPDALFPGLDIGELGHRSLYEVFVEQYGIEVVGGTQTMEASVTDQVESDLLGVALYSSAMVVDRITWMADNTVVEHTQSIYRGDRYVFTADLVPPPVT